MRIFRSAPVYCLALSLSACAPLDPKPPAAKASANAPPPRVSKPAIQPAAAPLAETKPAPAPEKITADEPGTRPLPPRTPLSISADLYLAELGDLQEMPAELARRELGELNGEKRLDKIQRFRLAALLSRDEHGDWERALKALEGLNEGADVQSRALVELLRKSLRARLELRQQNARVTELQQRIQQIKSLEKDLQQRSEPAKP